MAIPSVPATVARRLLPKRAGAASPGPVAKMTGTKVVILLSLALVFDALKFMATQLWFFGPALVGLAAGAVTGSALVGKVVGALGVATNLIPGVAAGIEMLGVVLAIAIGFMGWLIMLTLMAAFGIQFFKGNNRAFLRAFIGFLVSEIPLVDAIPSFTIATWSIISGERKAYKEEKKKHDAAQAAQLAQDQRLQMMQQRQMLEIQAAEAAQTAEEAGEQAAADAEEVAQRAAEEAEEEESRSALQTSPPPRQGIVGTPSLIPENR